METLPVGTELEFAYQVSQEKTSGRKRAVEVVLVRTSKEKREEEQLKKVLLFIADSISNWHRAYRTAVLALTALYKFDAHFALCCLPCLSRVASFQ